VRIEVELKEKFGAAGKLVFEVDLPSDYPKDAQREIETDVTALLTVFGGLALAVTLESGTGGENRGELLRQLMDALERFAEQRLGRGAA
jgi:hypothetical protein